MDIENEIINAVRASVGEAIKTKLGGYGSPLDKLIADSCVKHESKIRTLLDGIFDAVVTGEVADSIRQAAVHKVAKCLVSKMEGEVEKRANDIRSSPEMRAKITLAISKAINEVGT